MEINEEGSFEVLVERFLGPGFPDSLSGTVSLPDLTADTQGFIIRVLNLMKRSGYSLTQFNPPLIHWLSSSAPNILPGMWGGRIPPLTTPERHRKIDDYLAGQNVAADKGEKILLDIGCGFPPVTTADTARIFPDWQIYGVDRSFADYVVYDSAGHYACFNRAGEFLYFQGSLDLAGRALYTDPAGTINRFKRLFEDLVSLLQNLDTTASETVEKDGNTLIHNHIVDFEKDNLSFINSDVMDLGPIAAKVVRCMNMLIYFTTERKKELLHQIRDLLVNDGLLIIGTNGFGIQSRYSVYKKEVDHLSLSEFAISLDNLGHLSVMPWFTIHDDDPEAILLAELSFTIRSHPLFWPQFSNHLDKLLESYGFCTRKSDGFLHFPEQVMSPRDYLEKNLQLWREMQENGYAEGAVNVLEQAGYEAWINPAGDIAIRPPEGTLC